MSDKKQPLCVLLVCILLLISSLSTWTIKSIPTKERESVPAALDFWQMVPDPYLETEADAFVNGTSGEFLYDYENGTMHLNWTHTAGTELDFRSEDDSTYPSFYDFVYFTQSLEWSYEELPYFVIGDLNFSLHRSGDFLLSTAADWFNVYVWLIDSSGNWNSVLSSTESYQHQFPISSSESSEIWSGMIEDELGVQEDPTDMLTIGVGLAPAHRFHYFNGQEPWQIYSGAVSVNISSIALYAVRDVEPDPANHLSPLFNRTFKSDIHDLLPSYQGTITDVIERFFSVTKDPDGNIYLTGESASPYEIYLDQQTRERHQYIVKYDPSLNRQWVVRNDNQTSGRAITYHNGHLYTTGLFRHGDPDYYNVLLTKWDLSGRKIWQKEWGGEYDQVGVASGVHQDGSIYVVVSDYDIRSEPPDGYTNSSILKFDGSGNIIWSKPLPWSTYFDDSGELWILDSHLIYSYHSIIAIDFDGSVLWQKPADYVTCDENGTIYSVRQDYYTNNDGLNISKLDSNGNEIWNVRYEIKYPLDLYEYLYPIDIALTTDDKLLVLIQGGQYDRTYRLLKYSLHGTLLETWTIGDSTWPKPLSNIPQMESTSTGLVYMSYGDVWTQAFVIGPYALLPPITGTLLLAVGGGIGVMAIVGFYVYRKKLTHGTLAQSGSYMIDYS
ncbi:MAG: hypothetical protein RTU92_11410 [Candidatus Thorarchaeota archaeon]